MGRYIGRHQSWTWTAGIGGTSSISIPVPGTFTQMTDDNSGTNGRYLKQIDIWTDSPAAGDQVKSLSIQDTNGVIPAGLQGQFPLYPIVLALYDNGNANQGLWIPSGGLTITPIANAVDLSYDFIPAGLFITGTFQPGNALTGGTMRLNLFWGVYLANLS